MSAGATAKEQLIVADQYRVAWARCYQVTLHVNPAALARAYSGRPDAPLSAQCVSFATSGHRGSAYYNALNEAHILAIARAIALIATRAKSTARCLSGSTPTSNSGCIRSEGS